MSNLAEREPVTTQTSAITMATAAITTIAAQTMMAMTTDPTIITLDSTATTTAEFPETNSIPMMTTDNNNNEGMRLTILLKIAMFRCHRPRQDGRIVNS